ncbi:tannase/feruloyl esterase family alpha/beta hydrolase [Pseudomonas fluorescens]|jgi:feruloyl esterase|uniref:tannase/feruloyl esterase family alpha/beta hydrolase n=1 Tax=Pseudomonas fluorescens TaxID=294 RepID=UPI000642844A|nr:tannase/feruloyl esterase family alpha/beta hydrolase [Pseudomonas fluorescens]
MSITKTLGIVAAAMPLAIVLSGCAPLARPAPTGAQAVDFASMCTPEAMASVASQLDSGVVVKQVPNGPQLPGGTKLASASGKTPAYCQATGSYVTNPETGKTANFIATFPERWNGKYLQLGCSGSCGYLLMNDPAAAPITITAQGYPGQLIEKGYAIFGNDLGHTADNPGSLDFSWMNNADGSLNADAIDDYLVRADRVMADMGKALTRAFYSRQTGASAEIAKSYFDGCSQGGREALVAATRFPEKFDGIIAGSPASDVVGVMWHGLGRELFAKQSSPAKLTTGQIAMLQALATQQCDAADGVLDGLIQNPAACNIHPSRDLPVCEAGQPGDTCLTLEQAQNLSVYFSGVTDENGNLLQPGMPISDQTYGFVGPVAAGMPVDADMRTTIGKAFDDKPLFDTAAGGPGAIDAFHLTLSGPAYRKLLEIMHAGMVMPEDFAPFLQGDGKLLWYHNLSDDTLTPYMSINRYKRLAELHGGYEELQNDIRFFGIPGSGHCGMSGPGPSNFDAIGTLEAWVEQGIAPNAIIARQLDPASENILMGTVDWSRPSPRTMPLCMFPQMAAYTGSGDFNDTANWECRASDDRMLQIGESGRQAGVLQ